jgi:hypothetical protein
VLDGELVAEFGVLLPRRGQLVAELLEQRLVVPEHVLREVVLQAVEVAVDRAQRVLGGEVLLHVGVDEVVEFERVVEQRALECGDVVRARVEDQVGPTLADLVGELDLAEVGGRVDRLELEIHIRVRLFEGLERGLAGRVTPDDDLRVGILFGACTRARRASGQRHCCEGENGRHAGPPCPR